MIVKQVKAYCWLGAKAWHEQKLVYQWDHTEHISMEFYLKSQMSWCSSRENAVDKSICKMLAVKSMS